MKTSRVVLWAVPPLVGLLLIGSQRPDRMLVGKWAVVGADETIEVRADGTYERLGWQMLYERRPVFAPFASVPHHFEEVSTHKGQRRSWGNYSFVKRNRVEMLCQGEEVEGENTMRRRLPQQFGGCGNVDPASANYEAGEKVVIRGDEAQVGGEKWKRVE